MHDNPLSRRRVLVAIGGASALAGCSGRTDDGSANDGTLSATRDDTTTRTAKTKSGEDMGLTGEYRIHDFVQREGAELTVNGEPFRYNGLASLLVGITAPS